jgi:LCP family protein required for cell wall assembly
VGDEREPERSSDLRPEDAAPGPGPRRARRGADGGAAAPEPGRANRDRDPGERAAAPGRINGDVDLDDLDPSGRARQRGAQRRGRRTPRRRKVLGYTALGLAGVLVAVVLTGFILVHRLLGEIATVSLDGLAHRPPAAAPDALGRTPQNILVLGSQTRDGQTLATHVGNASKDGTDLSDTAMLVHLSADRTWAEVVSIPRDLFVPIPACPDRLDPTVIHPAQAEDQFYDAMGEGGPACAVATVEQMTDIRVDHFVELTFDAFIQLTDAIGGVQVCIPPPGINDPDYSGLVLSAGVHTVIGNEALAFVRDRHGLTDGTDTQRIRMQQMFMTSLFDKLTSNGTSEDPLTLYKIASAVSGDITVDTGLDNLSTMISIAEGVGTVEKRYMQYVTAPYSLDTPGEYDYDPDGEHSSPGPGFDQLWAALRADQPLPGSPAAAAFGTRAPASPAESAGPAGSAGAAVPEPGTRANPDDPVTPTVTAAPSATPGSSGGSGTESRNGNENICSDLPGVADYGGSPGD